MRWKVFSVYDSAVGTYSPPMTARATGQALRDFMSEVNRPESRLAASPADYTLFELGEWDDEKAEFHPLTAPQRLLTAAEAIVQKERDALNS